MEYVQLGAYCEVTSSKRVFANQYTLEGIPFYRSREIIEKREHKNLSVNLYISNDLYNSFKEKFGVPQKGDILLTSVGTLGIPYIVQDEIFYFKDGNLTWMRNFSKKLLPQYIYYWINSKFGKDSLLLRAIGSSQPALTIEIIKKYKFYIRKIEEQQKIVSILSTYDDLIENNNRRIRLLEQMAENLYKEWFVRFRFPGHSRGETKQVKPKGWVLSSNSAYIECPKSWGFNEFIKIGKFVRGKNITADNMITGEIPVISAGIEPSGYHNACNVNGQSITISASGANAGYLKYHQISIWAADCSYCQDSNKLWFLYHSLKFLQPVISNMQTGAAQPHVYPKHINKLYTIIPDEEILLKFQEVVSPIYDSIKLLREKNTNLTKQRDMLLPRLMSGKLEV